MMRQIPKTYLFALGIVLGGTLVFSITAKPGQREPQSDLQMTMSTTTMKVCLGSSLPLELEITNHGSKAVKIDKADLWNSFSYSFSSTDGPDHGGGVSSSCSHCRGHYVVLKPGSRYESSFKYPLDIASFKDPGQYKIKMNYEQISTNELSFELYDCNSE